MKQIKTILLAATAALLFAGVAGCKKDTLKSNDKTFNIEKFKQNLKVQLGTSIVGYSVVISKDGQFADSIQYGNATASSFSSASTPMTMNTYINIASVTKTLTAIAAIKMLNEKGILIDSKIEEYLPAYWNATTAVENITFKELLTHTSGLRETTTSYDSLKAQCARGLDGSKSRSYANCNFALFRAILPYIDNLTAMKSNENAAVGSNNTTAFETLLSQRYLTLMQQNVFTPAGLSNVTCNDASIAGLQTNMFSEGLAMNIISTSGNWTETCAGGGYYLTTLQMANVMAYLGHSTTLLSAAQKTVMNAELYGWDPEDSPTTSAGKAYGKDGALIWTGIAPNSPGLQTYVCNYPKGIDVAISINSLSGSNFRNMSTLALTAYEASWD